MTRELPPDIVELAVEFDIHPGSLVETVGAQRWPEKRAAYRQSVQVAEDGSRLEIARRTDYAALRETERIVVDGMREYRQLVERIIALPSGPPAGCPPDQLADAEATAIERKLGLLGAATKHATHLLSQAHHVGLVMAIGSPEDAKRQASRMDFSKLTTLSVQILQVQPKAPEHDVTASIGPSQ